MADPIALYDHPGSRRAAACRPVPTPRGRLALGLVAALVLGGCGAAAPAVPPGGAGTLKSDSVGEAAWAQQVVDLTNQIRIENGLRPLVVDERAAAAAYAHSWDMDERGYFAHESPDGAGPAERLAAEGVTFTYAGENIARGQPTPEEVVKAWWESPDHRANLLYPGWTHVGVGVHSGPKNGPWWTQDFWE